MNFKINRNFVSKDEELLMKIDKKIGRSASQKREAKKAERIAKLRDDPNAEDTRKNVWEKF